MIDKLYKLYRKQNNQRKPLEDFNTECLAGVLKMSPDFLANFVKLLKLPLGDYSVKTQETYSIKEVNMPNCIVDMVLESDSTICFIENKVNSGEGWKQLERYGKVLDAIVDKETYLRYCTKRIENKVKEEHDFWQFRWFQIAKLIKDHHSKDLLASDYFQFLKQNNMALDYSISSSKLLTMENFINAYDTMKFHIEESLKDFQTAFPQANIISKININEIWEHERLSMLIEFPLKDTHYSEILYAINFDDGMLHTQIFVDSSHTKQNLLFNNAKRLDLFAIVDRSEYGLALRNSKKLEDFIGQDDFEEQIKTWFADSFADVRTFIDKTPELGWRDIVSNDVKQ